MEDYLTVIASVQNMKWKIGNGNSQGSSHMNQWYHRLLRKNRVDPIFGRKDGGNSQ